MARIANYAAGPQRFSLQVLATWDGLHCAGFASWVTSHHATQRTFPLLPSTGPSWFGEDLGITLVRTVTPLLGHLFEVGSTPLAWWEMQKKCFQRITTYQPSRIRIMYRYDTYH